MHSLFTRHMLEFMSRSVGSYSEDIVREFYASYVVNLRGVLDRQAKQFKKDPLTEFLVRGCRVDISSTSNPRFQSSTTGGSLSRVASFSGAEIRESPP